MPTSDLRSTLWERGGSASWECNACAAQGQEKISPNAFGQIVNLTIGRWPGTALTRGPSWRYCRRSRARGVRLTMISEATSAFVWIRLLGAGQPVVCGRHLPVTTNRADHQPSDGVLFGWTA